NQLQAQPNCELLTRLAGIGMARRTVGRALKMGVAETALTAARDHRPLTHGAEVGQQRLAVFRVDLRSGRHLPHDLRAPRAVSILAHATPPALRLALLLPP